MKIMESIFGEGVDVEKLDRDHLESLAKEAKSYIEDWPREAFEVEFSFDATSYEEPHTGQRNWTHGDTKKADIEAFELPKVRDFLVLMADGLGFDMDKKVPSDSDINHIFAFLTNFGSKVEGDRQTIMDDGSKEKQDVDYNYKIKSWKYDHSKDLITAEAVIDHVSIG